MKKLIAIALCAMLCAFVFGCGKKAEETKTNEADKPAADASEGDVKHDIELPEIELPEIELPEIGDEGQLSGGWSVAEDNTVTEGRKAVFDKAFEELVGVNYVPVAYLGSQVVAGTNHCFLTQATVVYPDAVPMFTLVYIYEDLSGNAEIMNIEDLPVVPNDDGTATEPIPDEPLMGGWAFAESPEITDEIRAKLEKALEEMVGASYEPIANLATQVVAGTNRCVLCKVTPIVPNAVGNYALVYVYEDLEGGAQVQYVISFDFGALCTYGA